MNLNFFDRLEARLKANRQTLLTLAVALALLFHLITHAPVQIIVNPIVEVRMPTEHGLAIGPEGILILDGGTLKMFSQ